MAKNKHSKIIKDIAIYVTILITSQTVACQKNFQNQIRSVMIPVRDGTKLATDLYFPDSRSKQYPVILIRTPYSKKLLREYGLYYSKRGYVTAIQDVRGKYDSGGDWIPYKFEGEDGYDVIEWLASQSWSNGKVGMVGGSYSGSVQLAAAIQKPPHLVTIIPNITPATPFNNIPYNQGAFALATNIRWTDIVANDISGREMNTKFGQVFAKNWYEELEALPVIDLDKKIVGHEVTFWREWARNEPGEAYYGKIDYLGNIHKIKIPVFLQSGWFDVATRGTKLIYQKLIESGNRRVKFIIGPWAHSDRAARNLGPLNLGEAAGIDLFSLYTRWFDYWLKGVDNGILDEPRVQLFNIGPNYWIYDNTYPIASSQQVKLYLSRDLETNKSRKGKLSMQAPTDHSGMTTFRYDPDNPTPSLSEFMKKSRLLEYQKLIDDRDDVVIFETEILEDSLTIAGSIEAVIYASSDALDTDFCLTLAGVNAKGKLFPLGQTFGIVRAKYRNSERKPQFLKRGQIYEFRIDLAHTCYTLAPGEKLHLELSSSSFPEFSRNLNTGKNNQISIEYKVAHQKIYHNERYPAHLIIYIK